MKIRPCLALFGLALLLLSVSVQAQNGKGKRMYIGKNPDNGVLFTSGAPYAPGDTIVIRASLNPWSYLYFGDISGTPEKPVVIINEGLVELKAGIDINNSRYIKVTGSGSKDKFGFRITGSGGGAISIHGKSANVEVERVYVADCAFGCWIKNEASCDSSMNSWVLDHVSVHDFEMHRMAIEGFYMGSTDPNNFTRPIYCNGVQKFNKPSKLGNIKIYNGLIDGTGRPAIMLSNASVGMSEIYNNVVMNIGREFNDQQGTGISLGGYTRAYVHHNKIRNTYSWGIASLGGSGLIRIENNSIDSSGYLDGRTLNWPQNIAVDTRQTIPVDSTTFIIRNNTVSNPGRDVKNIQVWSTLPTYTVGNIICGNTSKGKPALVDVVAGVQWSNCGVVQKSGGPSGSSPLLWIGGGLALLAVVVAVYIGRKKQAPRKLTNAALV